MIDAIRNRVNQSGVQSAAMSSVPPRQPLYGREVELLSRRRESNIITVPCIVAFPENLAFRDRLPERWLEPMPPRTPGPIRAPPDCGKAQNHVAPCGDRRKNVRL